MKSPEAFPSNIPPENLQVANEALLGLALTCLAIGIAYAGNQHSDIVALGLVALAGYQFAKSAIHATIAPPRYQD